MMDLRPEELMLWDRVVLAVIASPAMRAFAHGGGGDFPISRPCAVDHALEAADAVIAARRERYTDKPSNHPYREDPKQ